VKLPESITCVSTGATIKKNLPAFSREARSQPGVRAFWRMLSPVSSKVGKIPAFPEIAPRD